MTLILAMSGTPSSSSLGGVGDSFLLEWNNFSSAFLSSVGEFRDAELYSDVTLLAGEKTFHAHKIILSAGSLYFRRVFAASLFPSASGGGSRHHLLHPVVILKDVSPGDLEAVMQFLYLGRVHVEQDRLPSFLKTAESLEIREDN